MNFQLSQAVENIKELYDDDTLPKNVKQKITFILEILDNGEDLLMKKSKVMHELEDLVDDRNLQAYSRTQLFNIISMLERL